MSIRRRLGKGLQSQAFSQVVKISVQLANVPLLLLFWGKDIFGEWLILTAVSQYLSASSVGLADAASREMVIAESRGDRDKTLSLFQSTWGVLTFLSILILVTVVAVVYVLPIGELVNVSVLSASQVRSILITQSALVLLTIQANVLYCGFVCRGRYGEVYFYLAMMFLLNNAALFVSAWLGAQPDLASICMLAVYACCLSVMRFMLWRSTPWLRYGLEHLRILTIKELVKPSFAFMVTILSNALNIQVFRVFVGIILGPVSVVVFSTLRTLSRLTKMFISSFEQIITPELGIAFGSGEVELMKSIFERLSQVTIWLSMFACACLLLGGEFVLHIWTAGKVDMDYPLYFLLVSAVFINSFWLPSYVAIAAINKHFDIGNRFLLLNLVTILLAIVLMKFIGIHGAGVAVVFLEVAMCLFAIPRAMSLLDIKWPQYIVTAVSPPLFLLAECRTLIGRN